MTGCIKSTANAQDRIPLTGQSIHLMFLSFERTTGWNWSNLGFLVSLHVLPHMHPELGNRKPRSYCGNVFTACSPSRRLTDIARSFLEPGAVVPSRMIRISPLPIFGRLWRTTLTERSPTSSLPSQIGLPRKNFWVLFEMCLLKIEKVPW